MLRSRIEVAILPTKRQSSSMLPQYSTIGLLPRTHEAESVENQTTLVGIVGPMVEIGPRLDADEGSAVEYCRQKEPVEASCVAYWP
jgi:hypothetical protein